MIEGAARLTRVFGEPTGKALAKLGVHTTTDLLHHYPRRYADRGAYTELHRLAVGEHVTVIAKVVSLTARPAKSRSLHVVTVKITDARSSIDLTFFARNRRMVGHLEHQLQVGTIGMFSGVVKAYHGALQLLHPDFSLLDDFEDEANAIAEAERPVPIYRANAALPSWKIAQAVRTLLDPLRAEDLLDPIPPDVARRHHLMDPLQAMRAIHRPANAADWKRAQHRFKFTEAFLLQTALARRRADIAAYEATPRPERAGGLLDALDAQLPFTLTEGQRTVAAEIASDLTAGNPMQRLLQGEVGSGKTVVALRAMMQVIDAGGQAALLAPTEVLAVQHARSIANLLGPLGEAGLLGGSDEGTRITLLTGSLNAAQRRQALADAASGAAGIVIGTHALLGEKVQFADLGLTVIDEQHRFGVEQRDALRAKGRTMPHQLFMTATPIPRSVAMTFFGDVEVSTLREIPAGRSPITTHLVPADNERWLQRTWEKVAEEIRRGNRAYVVAPRISATAGEDGTEVLPDGDPDGKRPLATVEEVADLLRAEPVLAGIAIGVMHGRLPTEEKDAVMSAFTSGRSPLLVTTTVIEVGVDVPEATVMVVLDADRFGLSHLHQLRGRVGRGTEPGLCLLVSHADPGSPAAERLTVLANTLDGFELAEADLEQRREGDVLGAAQSGRGNSLRLLRVVADRDIIAAAREDARKLVAEDPNLIHHPELLVTIAQLVDPDHEEFLDRA